MNGLSCGEESMTICSAVLIQYQCVTDGQTYGRRDRRPAYIYTCFSIADAHKNAWRAKLNFARGNYVCRCHNVMWQRHEISMNSSLKRRRNTTDSAQRTPERDITASVVNETLCTCWLSWQQWRCSSVVERRSLTGGLFLACISHSDLQLTDNHLYE